MFSIGGCYYDQFLYNKKQCLETYSIVLLVQEVTEQLTKKGELLTKKGELFLK